MKPVKLELMEVCYEKRYT